MKCLLSNQENAALLLAYTSGRLETETAVQVQRHLESCPACQQFVQSQSTVWDALDLWQVEPVSPDFDRRLYQRIEQHVSWWDLMVRPFRPLFLNRGLPIAAAAGMLIAAGVFLDRQAPAPVVVPQESAQVESLRPDQVEHAVNEMELLNQFNHLMRSESADPNEKM